MTEMINRVATAMWGANTADAFELAKTAIAAMREPTQEMEAAWFAGHGWIADQDNQINAYLRQKSRERLVEFWQSMISACLGIEKSEPATETGTGSNAPPTHGG